MKFNQGDILLFNWNRPKWFSKALKFYNKKKYGQEGWTHAGIIVEVQKDQVLIYEAVSKGFINSYYNINFLNKVIADKKCIVGKTRIQLIDVKLFADQYLGRPYGILNMLGILLIFIAGKKALNIDGSKNLICSEAVARILYDASNRQINFEKEFSIPYDFIEPMHLYKSNQIKWQI